MSVLSGEDQLKTVGHCSCLADFSQQFLAPYWGVILQGTSMLFLIIKLLMLALSYKLYLMKKEPYFSALLFSISLAIVGLIMGHTLIGVFVGSAILFALAFVCFLLMSKVPNGIPEYSILAVTATIVVFVI